MSRTQEYYQRMLEMQVTDVDRIYNEILICNRCNTYMDETFLDESGLCEDCK